MQKLKEKPIEPTRLYDVSEEFLHALNESRALRGARPLEMRGEGRKRTALFWGSVGIGALGGALLLATRTIRNRKERLAAENIEDQAA